MILVSRCLERIGDHAVDIGEQTAYLVTGEFREFTDASHPEGVSDSRVDRRRPPAPLRFRAHEVVARPQDDGVLRPVHRAPARTRSRRRAWSMRASARSRSARCARQQVKELENQGDELTREIIELLNTQYITPFDREDIYELAKAIDDVVDLHRERVRPARRSTRSSRADAAVTRAVPDARRRRPSTSPGRSPSCAASATPSATSSRSRRSRTRADQTSFARRSPRSSRTTWIPSR